MSIDQRDWLAGQVVVELPARELLKRTGRRINRIDMRLDQRADASQERSCRHGGNHDCTLDSRNRSNVGVGQRG